MSIKEELVRILNTDSVFDDVETLLTYAVDQSFVEKRRPDAVVYTETVQQVQEVVRWANRTLTPVVPYSSGLNLHGAAVPRQGGIILNMSRMNKILEISQDNWHCVIEPGVTARQMQEALARKGLRAMLPFGVPPERSVLTSFLERDPSVAAVSFEYGNELIMDMELVLPDGELLRTGLWATGGSPGSPMGPVRAMLNRFWTGAQGTLGIVTKMNLKVEHMPKARKLFMIAFDSFPEALDPLRMILRRELGTEVLLFNNINLAALACRDWAVPAEFPARRIVSDEFAALRRQLPEWVLAVCIEGGPRQPEGKIAYEEAALQEVCAATHLSLYDNSWLRELLLEDMLHPWGTLKKFCYRGAVHDLSFKAPLRRFPDYQKIVLAVTNQYDYPTRDIGITFIPIERGRAFHCQVDFHCDPLDAADQSRTRNMWLEASRQMIDNGACFDRPYGAWSDMVYSRAGTYTRKLQELKRELDPHNILNPGQLCF
jgi:FAD/FMN-containing dehydrogenase